MKYSYKVYIWSEHHKNVFFSKSLYQNNLNISPQKKENTNEMRELDTQKQNQPTVHENKYSKTIHCEPAMTY